MLRARITATVNTMAAATLRITAAVVDVLAREHGITAAVRSPKRKKEGS